MVWVKMEAGVGWKRINGGLYYYRSRREGGRVRTEYLGPAGQAELFTYLDAEDKEQREAERERERAEREAIEREESELAGWFGRVEAIAQAALNAAGYHQHKRGEWRKRRHVRNEKPTDEGAGRGPGDGGRD